MTVIAFDRRLAAANRIIAEQNRALAQAYAAMQRAQQVQPQDGDFERTMAWISRIMAEG
jgi:hypothetical protein